MDIHTHLHTYLQAIELFIAADMYGIDRLKVMCESILQKGLNVENAAALLQIAEDHR